MRFSRVFCLVLSFIPHSIQSVPSIILYLQPAPRSIATSIPPAPTDGFEAMLNDRPSKQSAAMLDSLLAQYTPPIGGFLAVYAGYGDFSNPDGLVTFPLRHTPGQKLYLLITPNIELIKAEKNTIAHAKIPDTAKEKAVRYLFERKKDANNLEIWEVSQAPLPEDNTLTPRTIALICAPENIYVAPGTYQSHESGHIFLPHNVFVVGMQNQSRFLLATLDLLRFHEPIEFAHTYHDQMRHSHVMKNE